MQNIQAIAYGFFLKMASFVKKKDLPNFMYLNKKKSLIT